MALTFHRGSAIISLPRKFYKGLMCRIRATKAPGPGSDSTGRRKCTNYAPTLGHQWVFCSHCTYGHSPESLNFCLLPEQ